MAQKKGIPPYIERGVAALLLLLLGVGIGSLFTRIHRYEERLEQLEESLAAAHSRIDRMADQPAPQGSTFSERQGSAYSERQGSKNKLPSADYSQGKPESDTKPAAVHEDAYSRKYTEPRRFNLNHIDSITLVRIPGIAAKSASTILRRRERLGGFYDPWQLKEFMTWEAAEEHMEEWCTLWFTASDADVRHIRINHATEDELRQHPYISRQQAAEIVQYRTRHKAIRQADELANLPSFQPSDITRLVHYLTFD